jgi:hypothetical protein
VPSSRRDAVVGEPPDALALQAEHVRRRVRRAQGVGRPPLRAGRHPDDGGVRHVQVVEVERHRGRRLHRGERERRRGRQPGALGRLDEDEDDLVVVALAGQQQHVDQAPPGRPRDVPVEAPAALRAGGPHGRRTRPAQVAEGDAGEHLPTAQAGQVPRPQVVVVGRGQLGERRGVLRGDEPRGTARAGEHLGHLAHHDGRRLRPAVRARPGEPEQPLAGPGVQRRARHARAVDLLGGRPQQPVGERLRALERGPGHSPEPRRARAAGAG